MVFGKEPFSRKAVRDSVERGLYEYWLGHRSEIVLTEQQERVLEMYFGEKLSLEVIAVKLEIAAEKARTEKIGALNFIMQISGYREKD